MKVSLSPRALARFNKVIMNKYEFLENYEKTKKYERDFDDFILSRTFIKGGSQYTPYWISTLTGHRFYVRRQALLFHKQYYRRYINILESEFKKCVLDQCSDVQLIPVQLKLEV